MLTLPASETLATGINPDLQRNARLVAMTSEGTVDATRRGAHVVVPGGANWLRLSPTLAWSGSSSASVNGCSEEMATARVGVRAADCVIVGDRPDTDIVGAARLGVRTALVRTGRFRPGEPYAAHLLPPAWDLESLVELGEMLAGKVGADSSRPPGHRG